MRRKRFVPLTFTGLALLVPVLAQGAPHEFVVDPVHSHVGFKVRHLVAKVAGRFGEFEGTLRLDPANVETSLRFSGTVRTASIQTDNPKRDGHLRGPDFFNVEKYPEMTLVSKSIRRQGDAYVATVDFTLRGITREIELNVEYNGVMTSPFTGTPTTGLEITGTVNRKDFGMVWNKALDTGGFVLGDEVHLQIQIEATVPPQGPES